MSSPPQTGKRKEPEPQPERAITRQAIKNALSKKDTSEERGLLRDAIMAVYRGGCYSLKQAAEYGWSEKFVRFKVQQLPPAVLKADDERLDLFRSASDLAELSYKNAFTDSELRECLLQACTTNSKHVDLFRRFGVGKTTFYKMYKMLPENIKELPLDEQRKAIDVIQRPAMGPKPYLTPDESKLVLLAAAAQKRMGDGLTIPTLAAKLADSFHQNAKAMAQNDPSKEERLRNAVVSTKYVSNLLKNHGEDVGISSKTAKTSKKSLKRAEVSCTHTHIACNQHVIHFSK